MGASANLEQDNQRLFRIRQTLPSVVQERRQQPEDDLPAIVVYYRYSTSPDLALDHDAIWSGPVFGRSLATVVSDLRRLHSAATDVVITSIEWRDGEVGERQ